MTPTRRPFAARTASIRSGPAPDGLAGGADRVGGRGVITHPIFQESSPLPTTTPPAPRGGGRSPFDVIRRIRPDGSEYWSARDLMRKLGYIKWERMADAVDRAVASCRALNLDPVDH